jgi:hypothetical protein
VISFGFWPGDDEIPEPSYYSYTAPEPAGLRLMGLPTPARWTERGGGALAILPFDAVRGSRDPRVTLLAFLQGAYEAGATAAGWDVDGLESSWCPTPEELAQLFLAPEEV